MRTTLIPGLAGERDRGLNSSAGLEASKRLLQLVADNNDLGRVVRLYRPAPTVAFSRRETRLDGFAEAVAEATVLGFEPYIRPAGGRAVVLDPGWFVLDVITPEDRGRTVAHRDVFAEFGSIFVKLFRELGIETHVAPVDGEYCPGDYSVTTRGAVKLVGTAQRVTRGARLFSASIPFALSPNISEMLTRVNALLDLEWSPSTLGAVSIESPQTSMHDLEAALRKHFAPDAVLGPSLADFFSPISERSDSPSPAEAS
jgi:lipoate-protein ligase A